MDPHVQTSDVGVPNDIDTIGKLIKVLDTKQSWSADAVPNFVWGFIYSHPTFDYSTLKCRFLAEGKVKNFAKCLEILTTWEQEMNERKDRGQSKDETYFVRTICKEGCVELLDFAMSTKRPWGINCVNKAVNYGHLSVVKYLFENWDKDEQFPWDDSTIAWGIESSSYDCVVYCYENGCLCPDSMWGQNGEINDIRILKYLLVRGVPLDMPDTYLKTCTCDLDVFKYFEMIYRDKFLHSRIDIRLAICKGRFDTLQYYVEKYDPINIKDIGTSHWVEYCQEFGKLEMLEYLHSKKFPLYVHMFALFNNGQIFERNRYTKGGYLDIMKFLIANGCTFTKRMVLLALENGFLPVIKYLVGLNICEITKSEMIDGIAQSCDLDSIKWAINEYGCMPTEETFNIIVSRTWSTMNFYRVQNVECLEYLANYAKKSTGCHMWTSRTLEKALDSGNFYYALYMMKNGVKYSANFLTEYAKKHYLSPQTCFMGYRHRRVYDVFVTLIQNGCNIDKYVYLFMLMYPLLPGWDNGYDTLVEMMHSSEALKARIDLSSVYEQHYGNGLFRIGNKSDAFQKLKSMAIDSGLLVTPNKDSSIELLVTPDK